MNLSNENRLLLYCAQTEIPRDQLDKIKDILKLPLNWEEVLKSAIWHRIDPLLFYNLKDIKESCLIPREIMDQLRKGFYENLVTNTYIYAELKKLLVAFRKESMDVIILKGADLAETVYDNIGLRPMNDIDLLVKNEDVLRAERIMSGLDYVFLGHTSPEWYRENHHEVCYIQAEKKIRVDIHWHISNKSHPFRIRYINNDMIEEFWGKARSIELSGIKALILCPEDSILFLSLHFIKHRFKSENGGFSSRSALIQMCDIYQTLKHYRNEINWVELRCKAERYGMGSNIYITLLIVREFIGETNDIFHNAINVFISEHIDEEILRIIIKKILLCEEDFNLVPSPFIKLQVAPTFHEKVKNLLRIIFPSPKSISTRYHVSLSSKKLYFYYFIRPLSLLSRYRKMIFEIPRIKEDIILNRWIRGKD